MLKSKRPGIGGGMLEKKKHRDKCRGRAAVPIRDVAVVRNKMRVADNHGGGAKSSEM